MTATDKQKIKKYTVFALMAVICAGCIRFIFAPSADEKARQEAQTGFNTDIPMPQDRGLVGDKRDAYEQERIKERQEERMRSLQDFSSLLGDVQGPADDLALLEEPEKAKVSGGTGRTGGVGGAQNSPESSIQNSARAYRDINRTLGNFYETPQTDPEKEKLQQELEELRKRMDERENDRKSVDEQMAVMERSYQMAAKYLPLNPGTVTAGIPGMGAGASAGTGAAAELQASQSSNTLGKNAIVPVGGVNAQPVSILRKEMSSLEIMEAFEKPRNTGFLTATSESDTGLKNTISACVHETKPSGTGRASSCGFLSRYGRARR
jgi:conjugative transposon TraM protein